jgi:hypothetical protein
MEEALMTRLLSQSALTALVGAPPAARITWAQRPQGSALPAIVLHTISGPRSYTMQGEAGVREARVQADVWGATYSSAKAAARQLMAALSGQRFTGFQAAFVDTEDDGFERSEAGEALYRVRLDFLLWREE